ncbi:cis-muuroladiene synthase [Phtheirospermum japonicum]|uniref:Cis-muuroladiene synthase n=1 Tax=Phtheirospermum japonicum TaxID=374723 RepID=A0A830BRB6_9LAMI|nr:cis-muuroladiene synthase [Phtheirospermum japonicum]
MGKGKTTSERLVLIDTLERLGVAYHFDQETEEQLEVILKSDSEEEEDLFTTALRFRLLRQHRHFVSCSVFNKFKGEDNKFKETLNNDAKGLLSLYEAAHVRIHGEQILDEAVAFTVHHLKRMVQQLESPLQDQVKRALEQPLHRGIPRIETRYYIPLYEKDCSKNELLLKLAKLDFNYLQNMYKNELHELSRWWNELNPGMPYARNRVVEAYVWGLAYHFEPQYSYARVGVTKSIQMLTVLDDTYDNCASVEESDLFTKIMERWNIDEIDQLPDYMKPIYECVLRIYDDYERDAAKQGKLFVVPYAKQTVKDICRAQSKGLKWTLGGQMTSFEDYLKMTLVTSCIYVMCSATFPGMKSVSKETIGWLRSEPKIVIAAAKVCIYARRLRGHYHM